MPSIIKTLIDKIKSFNIKFARGVYEMTLLDDEYKEIKIDFQMTRDWKIFLSYWSTETGEFGKCNDNIQPEDINWNLYPLLPRKKIPATQRDLMHVLEWNDPGAYTVLKMLDEVEIRTLFFLDIRDRKVRDLYYDVCNKDIELMKKILKETNKDGDFYSTLLKYIKDKEVIEKYFRTA